MTRFFIITILSLYAVTGFSQNKKPGIISDSSFKEVNLNEVTIAAGRFAEMKKHVPQQVQTISAGKIRFLNQQTTAEMLTHTGNILVYFFKA